MVRRPPGSTRADTPCPYAALFRAQGENQPYGQVWEVITKAVYPEGHPCSHTVIGSMADLNAASLEDVKNWFRTWYGPNNAVLVLAGDIDLDRKSTRLNSSH